MTGKIRATAFGAVAVAALITGALFSAANARSMMFIPHGGMGGGMMHGPMMGGGMMHGPMMGGGMMHGPMMGMGGGPMAFHDFHRRFDRFDRFHRFHHFNDFDDFAGPFFLGGLAGTALVGSYGDSYYYPPCYLARERVYDPWGRIVIRRVEVCS